MARGRESAHPHHDHINLSRRVSTMLVSKLNKFKAHK